MCSYTLQFSYEDCVLEEEMISFILTGSCVYLEGELSMWQYHSVIKWSVRQPIQLGEEKKTGQTLQETSIRSSNSTEVRFRKC